MATRTNIGKSLYVSAALPATNNAAGFEALAWTEVEGVQSLPQLGFTHAIIDIPDLKSGRTEAAKGSGSGTDASMSFRMVDADAGQALLKTASDSPTGVMSIKIGTGSGTANALATGDPVQYAQGFVHSYLEIQGDSTTHEGFTASFRQNDLTIIDDQPA